MIGRLAVFANVSEIFKLVDLAVSFEFILALFVVFLAIINSFVTAVSLEHNSAIFSIFSSELISWSQKLAVSAYFFNNYFRSGCRRMTHKKRFYLNFIFFLKKSWVWKSKFQRRKNYIFFIYIYFKSNQAIFLFINFKN